MTDVEQFRDDWLTHAKGCRRRAHEYKRWALEYREAGNVERFRYYQAIADRSWRSAKSALASAKIFNSITAQEH